MAQQKKQEYIKSEPLFHLRNKHQGNYDFVELVKSCPELAAYIVENKTGNESINFFDNNAVRLLNLAILKHDYAIKYWSIPKDYLCPPIPGRADYIHHIADLLKVGGEIRKGSSIKCLDIGVGANCIYPIIGVLEYAWSFVGSDIDPVAIQSASKIVELNENLTNHVELRLQINSNNIFKGIIKKEEKFHITICNPPFHASAKEAQAGTLRKLSNLKGKKTRRAKLNFGGMANELWCEGGEKEFVTNMIEESQEFANSCLWFSTLVSKETNVPVFRKMLKKVKAQRVSVINMKHGNKKSRIVAWSFQN